MTVELLFNLSNLFVLPFWGLMILLPRWQWTEKVMKSPLPIAILASVYLYLFIGSLSSESAAALASPELSVIAQAFADEKIMAVGWVHYLVMDLLARSGNGGLDSPLADPVLICWAHWFVVPLDHSGDRRTMGQRG